MRIFFSVGEPSGDLHGGKSDSRNCSSAWPLIAGGLGGPKMRAAGCDLIRDMSDLARDGIVSRAGEVAAVLAAPRAGRRARSTSSGPMRVVLIDYPGFNWHVARMAKERRHSRFLLWPAADLGLGLLAREKGAAVTSITRCASCPLKRPGFESTAAMPRMSGIPISMSCGEQWLDETFLAQSQRLRSGRVVTLLPGSRTQEVQLQLAAAAQGRGASAPRSPRRAAGVASYNELRRRWPARWSRPGPCRRRSLSAARPS